VLLWCVCILCFNNYIPCDTSYDFDNCDIFFQDILNAIRYIYYKYEHIDYVIIGGDFNTDLRRITSLHTQTLNVFVKHVELECCDISNEGHIIYMYENVAASTVYILYHLIGFENLLRNIIDYRS